MNQILIGMILSFIFFSCEAPIIKEQPVNATAVTDITKEDVSTVKEQFTSNEVDSIEIDSSRYNQYKNGKKEGLWKEVDKNGVLLSEGYYKNGRANGWMKWYYRGILMAEGNMINDKRNGPWMICDLNDSSDCINAYFEHESREGVWKTYHDNGQLHREQVWENDQAIAEKCWDEIGTPMSCE
mgnify:CR=1 FL=1